MKMIFLFLSLLFIALIAYAMACSYDDKKGNDGDELIYEGVSEVFRCDVIVQDKVSAARCFNAFFEIRKSELEKERGELTEDLKKAFEPVTESNIVINNGIFRMIRNAFGTPYFIQNSVIYMEHG